MILAGQNVRAQAAEARASRSTEETYSSEDNCRQAENDKTLNTALWLKYEANTANRTRVVSLKCSRFLKKLTSMRNFNAAFVEGSVNLRVSSVKDHAASDMHSRAMLLLKKQVGLYRTHLDIQYVYV